MRPIQKNFTKNFTHLPKRPPNPAPNRVETRRGPNEGGFSSAVTVRAATVSGAGGAGQVAKGYPKYVADADKADKAQVYVNTEHYFEGVRPEVWEFRIGGYQVWEKWLKDRRGGAPF